MPLAFISYRRQDSSAASRLLEDALSRAFGPDSVFMDTERIRGGQNWRQRLSDALERADALIVMMGPQWLSLQDGFHRRRIDLPDDWVCDEIQRALGRRIPILTVRVAGCPRLVREALPSEIGALVDWQDFDVRDDHWASDLEPLFASLEHLDFRRVHTLARLPPPRLRIRELAPDEIQTALDTLGGWRLVTSDLPGREPRVRRELTRTFEFRDFPTAMRFMTTAAEHVATVNHHPRWENLWRTVTVWLTTWDIGHNPSQVDVELARHLEELARGLPKPRHPS